MAHGVRALADVLIGYQTRHHLFTIQAMINRWAPPVENNTSAYVTDVAKECGVDPDDTFPMTIKDNVLAMVAAIINHENGAPGGQSWVSDDDIQAGVDMIMP